MITYSDSSNSVDTTYNIIIYNSITNNLNDEKRDTESPFSFLDFLKYSGTNDKNINELELYNDYLKDWESTSTLTLASLNVNVRNQFIAFLSQIKLVFLTPEEQRFFDNIDLNNNEQLTIAVPFFSKKIKEIALYFKKKRDSISKNITTTKIKGTAEGVKRFIEDEIVNIYSGDDVSKDLTIPSNLNDFLNNIYVNVEQVYDDFNDYYDLDPDQTPTFYSAASGSRNSYFTSNVNRVIPEYYNSLEESISEIINNQGISLKEIPGIKVTFNTTDLKYIEDRRFLNYKNTNKASDLNYLNQKELARKFLGTDLYMVSANNDEYIYKKLVQAASPHMNLLNVNNPTSVSIPGNKFITQRERGLFFKPASTSILKMESSFIKQLILPNIIRNKTYIVPDPDKYGNIHGVGGSEYDTPFKFTLLNDNYKNISNSFGKNLPKINSSDQSFYSYSSLEQRQLNFDNENINKGIEQYTLSGSVLKEQGDIFGNKFYALNTYQYNSKNIDNLPIADTLFNKYTTEIENVVTEDLKESITFKRRKLKPIYVYNIVKNSFSNIGVEFEGIFDRYKYNEDLYNQLNGGLYSDINIFNDTFFFKTSSYMIIENVSISNEGKFIPQSFVSRVKEYNRNITFDQVTKPISNFSNPVRIGKDIYFVKAISDPNATNSPNLKYIEFDISKYDRKSKKEFSLVTAKTTTESYFTENFTFNLGSNITQIDDIELSYNSKQNKFMCVTTFFDLNNVAYTHLLMFTIVGNSLKISLNIVIAPDNYYTTDNFYTEGILKTNYKTNKTLGISIPEQDSYYGTLRF